MPSVVSRTPAGISGLRAAREASAAGSRQASGDSPMEATGENRRKAGPACARCVSEMRPAPRRISDVLASRDRFKCPECGRSRTVFRLDWTIALRIAPVLICLAGLFAFVARPAILAHRMAARGEADDLARARAATGGELSPFEQMMSQKPRVVLNNDQILQLWKAQVSTPVILQMVRTSYGDYDVSTGAIIALKEAGVQESIILAMIDANYAAR